MSRTYIWQLWDRLQSSFWFLPLVYSVIMAILAHVLLRVDLATDSTQLRLTNFVLSADTDALRGVVVSIAAATLTTGGIVFTLLTLPLSVVVAQFGSRLVRVYLRDRTTQMALGFFAGTFTYCVVLALALPSVEVDPDPPVLSVSFALLLALICFASLVVLVHHIGVTLQAPNIIAAASRELRTVVGAIIEQSRREVELGSSGETQELSERIQREGKPIHADRIGYVQFIDVERLMPLASRKDLMLRLVHNPGDFVEEGELLAYVWPSDRVTKRFMRVVQRSFYVGNTRIPNQDMVYAINQVTEVGVRALSSAINDPYTAMTALDHVAAALGAYGEHVRAHSSYIDSKNKVRVLYTPTNFSDLVDAAYDLPRINSEGNKVVLLHLLESILTVARRTQNSSRLSSLLEHVGLIEQQVQLESMIESDRVALLQRCQATGDEISARIEAPAEAGVEAETTL